MPRLVPPVCLLLLLSALFATAAAPDAVKAGTAQTPRTDALNGAARARGTYARGTQPEAQPPSGGENGLRPPTKMAIAPGQIVAEASCEGGSLPSGGEKETQPSAASASPTAPTAIAPEQLGAEADRQLGAQACRPAPADGGYRLAAPMQDIEATITRDGMTARSVSESEGAGEFRIVPVALDRAAETPPAPASPVADSIPPICPVRPIGPIPPPQDISPGHLSTTSDNAILLDRGSVIERFTASSDGIRQDFLIPKRLGGDMASRSGRLAGSLCEAQERFVSPDRGPLALTLAVTGASVEERPSGEGVRLTLPGGRVLDYARLKVTDADGKELSARMEIADSAAQSPFVRILVADADARYPVTIDPTITDDHWDSVLSHGVPGTDQRVVALAYDSSGSLYVGGEFSVAGDVVANCIARWDGANWSSLGTGMNGVVNALACDSVGSVYAGGEFTSAGGIASNHVAKWNGSSWSALGAGTNDSVNALALDASGNLFAGGDFTSAGGVAADYIARWDGASWSSLGSGMSDGAYGTTIGALACDGSGNLYAGGNFTVAGGVWADRIAKWDGASWSPLGAGMSGGGVAALVCDAAGNVYAGGSFTQAGGVAANHIAKWDGTIWRVLGAGLGAGYVGALACDGEGRIYAGGYFYGGGADFIAEWDGENWSALGTGIYYGTVDAIACDVAGNVYAGGYFYFNSNTDVGGRSIAKWDGAIWSELGTGADGYVSALASDAAGNLYAGGHFSSVGGAEANYIARWDGAIWSALGTGTGKAWWAGQSPVVSSLASDTAGNLYAGGQFTSAGGVAANYIAKWDGTTWSALGSGMSTNIYESRVSALVCDASGNLYAGGSFTSAGGVASNYIAKWDGENWSALGTGMNGVVNALAFDTAGNLYAGGCFTTAGGAAANYIARWDGTNWSALGAGIGGYEWETYVSALVFDASGNLHVGGGFISAGDVEAGNIAKWDGANWSALGTGTNNTVYALACDPAGNLYAGGGFTLAGGVAANRIAKWDGTNWSELGTGAAMRGSNSSYVYALAFDASGDLCVGGDFVIAGGKVAPYIARCSPGPPRVLSAVYHDLDNDELAEPGEQVSLLFDRAIQTSGSLATADFYLPVAGDGLGGAGFSAVVSPVNRRALILTLGSGAMLTPAGTFSMDSLVASSSSGVDIACTQTSIYSLGGVPATDGGVPGMNDSGKDILFAFISDEKAVSAAADALIQVSASTDAAYTSHALTVPAGALNADTTITMRPPMLPLGVPSALQIVTTPTAVGDIAFNSPVTLRLQYLETDIDPDAGILEASMRVFQLVENASSATEWRPVPGTRAVDRDNNTVTIEMDSLDPLDNPGGDGIFAALPGSTIEPTTGYIRREAGGSAVIEVRSDTQGWHTAPLAPGATGDYTRHRIEFPGFVLTDPGDANRIKVDIMVPTILQRRSCSGRPSFPGASAALFVVQTRNASGTRMPFTDQVNLRVQFMQRNSENQYDDIWDLTNNRGTVADMRLVHDTWGGLDDVDFVFEPSVPQMVNTAEGYVEGTGITNLTSSLGEGIWGAAALAATPPLSAGNWMLYK